MLFADIAGFTSLADHMRPNELVDMLNELFSRFDTLVGQHALEKIKTIGDTYMVVGGAPNSIPEHACRVANLALEMLHAMQDFTAYAGSPLQIRIGMHSGPAVAGVIGLDKFSYDLWGDTVNTASRMESYGLPGSIQLSESCRSRLSGAHHCKRRGGLRIKGKGEITTYLLLGRRNAPPGISGSCNCAPDRA